MTLSEVQQKKIHKLSLNNVASLAKADNCGCFYCKEIYAPHLISDWTDEGNTALCAKCGIDSVIADNQTALFGYELLSALHIHWFGNSNALN